VVNAPRIGIMGGMFDPVHKGHLQLAHAALTYCRLDLVKLIPCGTPVHRDKSVASAAQRVAMLRLACSHDARLQVDTREVDSEARSYTYDTATALRAEHPDAALFLVLGLDAFLAFDTWHRWQDLLGLVHLLVAVRPGYTYASCKLARSFHEEVGARMTATADAAAKHSAGRILMAALDLPNISSTQVRRVIRVGEDPSALVPSAVADYIATNKLYG
jgi:nicotinate-nucleotide adenylyltransferase